MVVGKWGCVFKKPQYLEALGGALSSKTRKWYIIYFLVLSVYKFKLN